MTWKLRTSPPSAFTSATPSTDSSAWPDDPIEDPAQFHVRVAAPLHEEHVDVTQRHGDRCEAALDPLRQAGQHLADPLGHLLARPVDIGRVLEVDGDHRQRVLGDRAQDGLVLDAAHLDLDRVGDPLLDFDRRHPRRLDDDLNLGVRDVGEGVDRELPVGVEAPAGEATGATTTRRKRCERENLMSRLSMAFGSKMLGSNANQPSSPICHWALRR